MYALTFAGKVIQVEPHSFAVHPSMIWVECGSEVQPGWSVVDGVPIAPEAPPELLVPFSITPLQARKALREVGLKEMVDRHIAALDEETREAWEYASVVERTHPAVLSAAAALGMSEQQVDDLFRLAARL